MEITAIIAVIGILVAITNVVVEVVKKVTWEAIPTNILVIIVALALTLSYGFAYIQINAIAVTWYIIVALIVLGFMVAYAAMFGFDKLKEIMEWGNKEEDNDGEQ